MGVEKRKKGKNKMQLLDADTWTVSHRVALTAKNLTPRTRQREGKKAEAAAPDPHPALVVVQPGRPTRESNSKKVVKDCVVKTSTKQPRVFTLASV